MVLLKSTVALALIAFPFSDAFPTKEQDHFLTVRQVPRIRKDNSTGPHNNGAAALHKALTKYGASGEHVDIVSRAASIAASGPVAATPPSYADVEYDCPVTIGSQTFKLDFDTGSSDTWVLGTATAAKGHTLYSPGKTATLQSGSTWKISYGDGSSASGTVYNDTIKIGNTVVSNQAIEMASSASTAFTTSSRPSDGLLGLAFDTLNTVKPTKKLTFFTNAINQGLPSKVFTARLKKGQAGTYTFGAIDPSQYSGSITYTPVDSSGGFWVFTPTSYICNGQQWSASASVLRGIADTGTTLLLLDNSIVSNYYRQISTAGYASTYGGYVFPCAASLPSLTMVINGYKATVPGNYMNYARVNTTHCYGGLQSNSGIGFNIYGDIFLKSQFVVFDRTQSTPRLGFAVAR